MSEDIIYRKTRTQDFLALAALDRDMWGQHRGFIHDGEHVWRIWVEYALVYCAEHIQKIIGGIVAFPTTTGNYCIHKAFVEQSYRGQGVGTQLFTYLLQELDTLHIDSFLTVAPDNDRAIRIYEKLGFIHRKFVKSYYREEEDRFVLTRYAGNNENKCR